MSKARDELQNMRDGLVGFPALALTWAARVFADEPRQKVSAAADIWEQGDSFAHFGVENTWSEIRMLWADGLLSDEEYDTISDLADKESDGDSDPDPEPDPDPGPPPVTAAVDMDPTNPEFELLHPRDRKGRWIEKGGVVKIFPKSGRSQPPLIGQVDNVASDGSVNITLADGRKVNAQPNQLEGSQAVARLDAPPPTHSAAPAHTPEVRAKALTKTSGNAADADEMRDEFQDLSWDDVVENRVPGYTTSDNNKAGVNQSYWITNEATGERYLVKNDYADGNKNKNDPVFEEEPDFDFVGDMFPNDEATDNEEYAARLFEAMGWDAPPPMVTVEQNDQDRTRIIVMKDVRTHTGTRRVQSYGELSWSARKSLTVNADSPDEMLKFMNLTDNSDLARMQLFDVMTPNADRHAGNWLFTENDDGTRNLHPIDHGILGKTAWNPDTWKLSWDAKYLPPLMNNLGVERIREIATEVADAYNNTPHPKHLPHRPITPDDIEKLIAELKVHAPEAPDTAERPTSDATDGSDRSTYVRPGAEDAYPGLGDSERARLHGELQSNSGLQPDIAQRVVDHLDLLRKRYGIRVGGVGQVSQAADKYSQKAGAFVTQDGFLAFNPDRAADQALSGDYSATDSIESLVTHEMTHMLQFGFSERGAAAWKYAGSAAEHHVTQKYFGGDRIAYLQARAKVSGYGAEDANNHEAQAEMLAAYLHKENIPEWLVTWGDTVTKIHNSDVDFSAAWGYGQEGAKPSLEINPPWDDSDYDPEAWDDPNQYQQVEERTWSEIGRPEGHGPPGFEDDWGSQFEIETAKSGQKFVRVPNEDGTETRMGMLTASTAHWLQSQGYDVRDGWDGLGHSDQYAFGWAPAAIRFNDRASWERFIRDSGLNVVYSSSPREFMPLMNKPPSMGYLGAVAFEKNGHGDDLFQVQYNPYLVKRLPIMMWHKQAGFNPDLPPVPPEVAAKLGIPDLPVQKPGELEAVKPLMVLKRVAEAPAAGGVSAPPAPDLTADLIDGPGLNFTVPEEGDQGYDEFADWQYQRPGMTPEENHALDLYIDGDMADSLNTALRRNDTTSYDQYSAQVIPFEEFKQRMDSAIAKSTLTAPGRVHRVLLTDALDAQLVPGGVIQDQGYMSTSTNMSGLEEGLEYEWEGAHVLHISLPAGSHGAVGAGGLGPDNQAQEWILPRDSKIRIDSKNADGSFEATYLLDEASLPEAVAPIGGEEPVAGVLPPDNFADIPVTPDGLEVKKGDVIRVRRRKDQAGTAGDETGEIVEGRVAQLSPMGTGYPTVIEVDPLDGSPRIRAVADQVEHTGAPQIKGIDDIRANPPGPVPNGIPEDLASASWADIVNGSLPGYSTEANEDSGVNASYWVRHDESGARFLVKNSATEDEFYDPVEMNQNEVFAAEYLKMMNGMKYSPIAIGLTDQNLVFIQHAGDANNVQIIGSVNAVLVKQGVEHGELNGEELYDELNLSNPADVVRMTLMDMVTGNGDRHEENWLIGELPDGTRTIHPIDHGLLTPEIDAGPGYFQEFEHNAHVRLTRHLLGVMGELEFRELAEEVLMARDKLITKAPRSLYDAVRSKKTIDDEIDEIIAALKADVVYN